MTPVTLLRSASADIRRAARFYEEEASGLGEEFISNLERTFLRLSRNPELGTLLPRGARRLIVPRFPYLVIYRLEPTQIIVLAVAHQRRHPDAWLARL